MLNNWNRLGLMLAAFFFLSTPASADVSMIPPCEANPNSQECADCDTGCSLSYSACWVATVGDPDEECAVDFNNCLLGTCGLNPE